MHALLHILFTILLFPRYFLTRAPASLFSLHCRAYRRYKLYIEYKWDNFLKII